MPKEEKKMFQVKTTYASCDIQRIQQTSAQAYRPETQIKPMLGFQSNVCQYFPFYSHCLRSKMWL